MCTFLFPDLIRLLCASVFVCGNKANMCEYTSFAEFYRRFVANQKYEISVINFITYIRGGSQLYFWRDEQTFCRHCTHTRVEWLVKKNPACDVFADGVSWRMIAAEHWLYTPIAMIIANWQ